MTGKPIAINAKHRKSNVDIGLRGCLSDNVRHATRDRIGNILTFVYRPRLMVEICIFPEQQEIDSLLASFTNHLNDATEVLFLFLLERPSLNHGGKLRWSQPNAPTCSPRVAVLRLHCPLAGSPRRSLVT